MFSDLRKAGGGRDRELLSWKVGSSNMHMENANLIENLDWNQGRKIFQKINTGHYSPPTVTDLSESSRDALSVFPWTLTKARCPWHPNGLLGCSVYFHQFTKADWAAWMPYQSRYFLFQPLHHDDLKSPSSSIAHSAARTRHPWVKLWP